MSKTALIVGAGLGGLLCGRILQERGLKVTILEQAEEPGGALRSFMADGIRFDTGFHSVGGLGSGEPLEKIFRPLGLMNLPWEQSEPDEFIRTSLPFLRLNSFWEEEIQHVAKPYEKSVWRLDGGGKCFVDALSEGLDIRCGKKVVEIQDGTASCEDGSSFKADVVIADLHPRTCFSLVKDHVRPAYLKRLFRMSDGPEILTTHIILKEGTVPFVNHSIFIGRQVMIHFGEKDEKGFARSIDLLSFREGEGPSPEEMISVAQERLPSLGANALKYWQESSGGSAYGILKHSRADYIAPATPIPWLFLTGQSIGLHGILGTSVSALNTCKSIKIWSPERAMASPFPEGKDLGKG